MHLLDAALSRLVADVNIGVVLEQFDRRVRPERRPHLGPVDVVRRAALDRGLGRERDDERLRPRRERVERDRHVALALGAGQRDQGGPIVERVEGRKAQAPELEHVADVNGDSARRQAPEGPDVFRAGHESVLGEERLGRLAHELDADHLEAPRREPRQIFGLATKGHENSRPGHETEPVEVGHELGVGLALVKPDSPPLPAIAPQLTAAHGRRHSAPDGARK